MLADDFNAEELKLCLSQFHYEYNVDKIVKENTCFKIAMSTNRIVVFATNNSLSSQNTIAISSRLSEFHEMVITVIKMSFKKHSPTERHCRDYQFFDQIKFKNDLL